MDLQVLYNKIYDMQRELVSAAFEFGERPNNFIINDEAVDVAGSYDIGVKHGQAFQAVESLGYALNTALNRVGSLQSAVQIKRIKDITQAKIQEESS